MKKTPGIIVDHGEREKWLKRRKAEIRLRNLEKRVELLEKKLINQ
jgi:hypothetical protein